MFLYVTKLVMLYIWSSDVVGSVLCVIMLFVVRGVGFFSIWLIISICVW